MDLTLQSKTSNSKHNKIGKKYGKSSVLVNNAGGLEEDLGLKK